MQTANNGHHTASLSSLPTFSLTSPRTEKIMPNLAHGSHAGIHSGGHGTPNSIGSGPSSVSSTVQNSVRTMPSSRSAAPSEQLAANGMIASACGSIDFSHIPEGESLDFTLSASGDGQPLPTVTESVDDIAGDRIGQPSNPDPANDAFDVLHEANHSTLVTKCSAEVTEMLFGHYLSWIQQCLMDDFAMHVHEADRTDFEFKLSSRKGALEKFALQQYVNSTVQMLTSTLSTSMSTSSSTTNITATNTPVKLRGGVHRGSFAASMASSRDLSSRDSSNFVAKMRTLNTSRLTLKEQNKNKNRRIRNQDTSLTAELRNVIVLFISVKLDSAQLFTSTAESTSNSPSRKNQDEVSAGTAASPGTAATATSTSTASQRLSDKSVSQRMTDKAASQKFTDRAASQKFSDRAASQKFCYDRQGDMVHGRIKGFHFLSRTEEEFNDDQRIMNSFQDCMEVMTKIFKEHGGQMRQFIVDDKGRICVLLVIIVFSVRSKHNLEFELSFASVTLLMSSSRTH